MALWQFQIALVPKDWLASSASPVNSIQHQDGWDTSEAFAKYQPLETPSKVISNFFPVAKSWHDNLACWGNEETTDAQLWSEKGHIDSILFRVDLRTPTKETANNISHIADTLQCVLYYPELKEISKPTVHSIIEASHRSRASAFVANPYEYFRSIGESET